MLVLPCRTCFPEYYHFLKAINHELYIQPLERVVSAGISQARPLGVISLLPSQSIGDCKAWKMSGNLIHVWGAKKLKGIKGSFLDVHHSGFGGWFPRVTALVHLQFCIKGSSSESSKCPTDYSPAPPSNLSTTRYTKGHKKLVRTIKCQQFGQPIKNWYAWPVWLND